MNRLKFYRFFLWIVLTAAVTTLGFYSFWYLKTQVPDSICIGAEEEQTVDLGLKEVSVKAVKRQKIYPGGVPVGIYMEIQGIYVVGTDRVLSADGLFYEPAVHRVRQGDYIVAVNGRQVADKQELIACVQENQSGILILKLIRNEEAMQIRVQAVEAKDGGYKLGIWVKDDVQGIGTLTYLTEDRKFGALGHGITDSDTGELLEIGSGNLYQAKILDIVKGERGTPGEICGLITYADRYRKGTILKNTKQGIFGQAGTALLKELSAEPMEPAFRQEIQLGAAAIRSAVSGELKDYAIEIQEIRMNETNVNKGMVFRVTDEELISLTGGIVQGMSGSPIIQDGKIIGAVTHVLVNDPTRGYGIFIENMLEHVKRF